MATFSVLFDPVGRLTDVSNHQGSTGPGVLLGAVWSPGVGCPCWLPTPKGI